MQVVDATAGGVGLLNDSGDGGGGFGGGAGGHVDGHSGIVEDASELKTNASSTAGNEKDFAGLGRNCGGGKRSRWGHSQLWPDTLEGFHCDGRCEGSRDISALS